jgi:2-dehydro-3-deoxyphosphooctonate aldolase (KDO 8-P synthase)|tara:strand:+ start:4196 stop:4906 length:711 start_codon:yes stop_codon:yes gene_type:complete
LEIAAECKRVCDNYGIEYYFKASYDKANRTSNSGKRGVGIDRTLPDFIKIRDSGYKILTDVHDKGAISRVHSVVDVIQIPAFLCRQTDLIKVACATNCIVNIKKGQFLAPWDVKGILSKTEGAREVWITERGTSFGYNNLVVDFNGIQHMLNNYSVPVIFDATHSVQKPSVLGECSGGNRDYVPGLTRAAAALGVDNFFLEVHPDPDNAPSDGPNMLRLDDFERTVDEIHRYSYTG